MTIQHQDIALAVIEREGRCLVARRPPEARLGGLWEFPGGKIEPGETPPEAAAREALEETGLRVEPVNELEPIEHDYGEFAVRLFPVICRPAEDSSAVALASLEVKWVSISRLGELDMPPANAKLTEILALPR